MVGSWVETSDTLALQRPVVGEADRSWTDLCSVCNEYFPATHDCLTCNEGSSKCTSDAKVGSRESDTYYRVNGSWTTKEQDHVAGLQERGECYGNCGEGCPGKIQTLTLDCLDHDQCVRNGHWIALSWCDDEFSGTVDDFLFAPGCGDVETANQICLKKNARGNCMEYGCPSGTVRVKVGKQYRCNYPPVSWCN